MWPHTSMRNGGLTDHSLHHTVRPDVGDLSSYFDTIDRLVRGLEYLKRSDLKSQKSVMIRMVSLKDSVIASM